MQMTSLPTSILYRRIVCPAEGQHLDDGATWNLTVHGSRTDEASNPDLFAPNLVTYVTMGHEEADTCSMCLSEYSYPTRFDRYQSKWDAFLNCAVQLSCGHHNCLGCTYNWFNTKPSDMTCPLCRAGPYGYVRFLEPRFPMEEEDDTTPTPTPTTNNTNDDTESTIQTLLEELDRCRDELARCRNENTKLRIMIKANKKMRAQVKPPPNSRKQPRDDDVGCITIEEAPKKSKYEEDFKYNDEDDEDYI